MIKEQFLVPEHQIYLLNHSVGCLPKASRSHLHEVFLEPWGTLGSNAWPVWLNAIETFRENLAKLLDCEKADLCPQTNVSSAMTKLLFSLPKRAGRTKIVLSKYEFPSLGFIFSQVKDLGYELVWVEPDADSHTVPLTRWEEQLDEQVQMVVISHSTYGSSYLNPVEAICKKARDVGAYSAVDVAQTAGIIPIHVPKWECDFLVGSCIKWLCGGPGAGFLYVNPQVVSSLEPKDVGWFSHKNPYEFEIENFEFASDATRFWGGTPSIAPFVLASKSLELLQQIGIQKIHSHNRELCRILINAALEVDIGVVSPLEHEIRGGTVCLKWNNLKKAETSFQDNQIQVDFRPNMGLRFSPHIYNTMEQMEEVSTFIKKMT